MVLYLCSYLSFNSSLSPNIRGSSVVQNPVRALSCIETDNAIWSISVDGFRVITLPLSQVTF